MTGFNRAETTALLRALHEGQDGAITNAQWDTFLAWAEMSREEGFEDLLGLVLGGWVVPTFNGGPKVELRFCSTRRRAFGKVAHAAGSLVRRP